MMGHGEAPAPGVPLVIIAGLQANSMPGRAEVVESACSSPALGRLAHEPVMQRDLNMMLGIVVMSATLVIVVNVCVDLIDARLDPRGDRSVFVWVQQRPAACIGLARALALEPGVLVVDQPFSALDLSAQAQVLTLQAGLPMVLITRDLRVAAQIRDRLAIMRHGQMVVEEPAAELRVVPKPAYSHELLAAVPGQGWMGRPVRFDAV